MVRERDPLGPRAEVDDGCGEKVVFRSIAVLGKGFWHDLG
jgi:hypothetical protein